MGSLAEQESPCKSSIEWGSPLERVPPIFVEPIFWVRSQRVNPLYQYPDVTGARYFGERWGKPISEGAVEAVSAAPKLRSFPERAFGELPPLRRGKRLHATAPSSLECSLVALAKILWRGGACPPPQRKPPRLPGSAPDLSWYKVSRD